MNGRFDMRDSMINRSQSFNVNNTMRRSFISTHLAQ